MLAIVCIIRSFAGTYKQTDLNGVYLQKSEKFPVYMVNDEFIESVDL